MWVIGYPNRISQFDLLCKSTQNQLTNDIFILNSLRKIHIFQDFNHFFR